MLRILFVEDDSSLLASLSYVLEREGFAVCGAPDGRTALALASAPEAAFDLVLLDVNLPDLDGFQVSRRLRATPATAATPIIFVTARAEVDDVVLGLEQFADDYVTKPFHPRVLIARIHALLRRRGSIDAALPALHVAGLDVDADARVVRVDGEPVSLTRTEFDILLLFASRPRHVFTREAILDHVHADVEVTERTVDFQISGLRRKLGPLARCIETVRGVGYKLEG
jgi:two-component system phosphate regulon response regulator PhoB